MHFFREIAISRKKINHATHIIYRTIFLFLAHCTPQESGYSRRGTTQTFQQTKSKFKPNSLPVLNCLFAGMYLFHLILYIFFNAKVVKLFLVCFSFGKT